MSHSHHRGSGSGSSAHSGSAKPRSSQKSISQLVESLETHRVNTLTELCRIECMAATCQHEDDARVFQEPMTAAWNYYVTSNQLLTELRGLTPNYPFSGDILTDAQFRVRNDPESNRSWNLAWLCLSKIQSEYDFPLSVSRALAYDSNLLALYAAAEASKPEMWAEYEPTADELAQLTQCFEYEWTQAISTMLRHWSMPPTWY